MNATQIHPTAEIHSKAQIGKGCRIGAFCSIEENTQIGDGCLIERNVAIRRGTTIGNEVKIHPFVVLGDEPQHLRYRGEPTELAVGDRVVIREFSTLHRGTVFGRNKTEIGNDCYLMAYSHIAHDCIVGNEVILANGVQLAGHVEIGDHVIIGGLTGVSQFCRVGSHAFIGGSSMLRKDLPPFLAGKGNDFKVQCINQVGLEKRGFSHEAISQLRKLFHVFYLQNLTLSKAIEKTITELEKTPEIKSFIDFLRNSKMGIIR
jgi:UDP-N-acetylglucosamine acyltransferase